MLGLRAATVVTLCLLPLSSSLENDVKRLDAHFTLLKDIDLQEEQIRVDGLSQAHGQELVGFGIPTVACSKRALTISKSWGRHFMSSQLVFIISAEDRDKAYGDDCLWGKPQLISDSPRFRLELVRSEDAEFSVIATKCPKGIEYVACSGNTRACQLFLRQLTYHSCAVNEGLLFLTQTRRFSWLAFPEDDIWLNPGAFEHTLRKLNATVGTEPTIWPPGHGCATKAPTFCGAFAEENCASTAHHKTAPDFGFHFFSGFFAVNLVAALQMQSSLENDAISSASLYGHRFADMATGWFVGTWGFAEISADWYECACVYQAAMFFMCTVCALGVLRPGNPGAKAAASYLAVASQNLIYRTPTTWLQQQMCACAKPYSKTEKRRS